MHNQHKCLLEIFHCNKCVASFAWVMSFPFFAMEIQIMTFPVNCGDKGPLITFPEKKRGIRVYEKVSYFHE